MKAKFKLPASERLKFGEEEISPSRKRVWNAKVIGAVLLVVSLPLALMGLGIFGIALFLAGLAIFVLARFLE